jgi:hypothetical protein
MRKKFFKIRAQQLAGILLCGLVWLGGAAVWMSPTRADYVS